MKRHLKNIIRFFLSPLSDNLGWFLIILILTTTFDAIQFFKNGIFGITLAVISGKVLFSYLFSLPLSIKKQWFRIPYTFILLTAIGIFLLIDAFCVINLNVSFSRNFVAMIKGSNPSEAFEFFENYDTLNTIFYLSLLIFISIILFKLIKSYIHTYRHTYILLTLVILFFISSILSAKSVETRSIYKG